MLHAKKIIKNSQDFIELYDKTNLHSCLLFLDDLDMTIIRIKKQYVSNIKRIAVKNAIETDDDQHSSPFIEMKVHGWNVSGKTKRTELSRLMMSE